MSESYPPPPQPPSKVKHPTGFITTLIGAILIILEALVYLAIGVLGIIVLAIGILIGVLGIIFAILSIFFGYRGYMATEKTKRNIYGLIPFFIGLIVMVATTQIYVDFIDTLVVGFGGFMLAMGGSLISAGK